MRMLPPASQPATKASAAHQTHAARPRHHPDRPSRRPLTASHHHHHPLWSPLSHSPTRRRRAVSVRSFPCRSFFNPGCTGFTLGAAYYRSHPQSSNQATTQPPHSIPLNCCPSSPHSSLLSSQRTLYARLPAICMLTAASRLCS